MHEIPFFVTTRLGTVAHNFFHWTRIIEINDSVYTFNEVVSHIDLKNTLYCQEHGMEKYMKFPMYEKEIKDKKYRDDPYNPKGLMAK